jgi:hypothetical protein
MHNEIVVGLDDSPSGLAALRGAAAQTIRSHASRPVVAVPSTPVARATENPGPVLDHATASALA